MIATFEHSPDSGKWSKVTLAMLTRQFSCYFILKFGRAGLHESALHNSYSVEKWCG